MANDDHIAQLMKGVDAWNAWRNENPDTPPDLSHAKLRGAKLSKVEYQDPVPLFPGANPVCHACLAEVRDMADVIPHSMSAFGTKRTSRPS
jgi:hypothetical protein